MNIWCWKYITDRLAPCKIDINFQFAKNVLSAKHNEGKSNNMRYGCIYMTNMTLKMKKQKWMNLYDCKVSILSEK